jgi:hypothetical protein
MRTTPKTAKEIAESGLWPAGTYDYEVLTAEDTISKAGADMIKLKVKIFNDEGNSQIVFDYLLDAMPAKLRHAAEAFGLIEEYEAGGFDAIECEGKTGRCKVTIQKDKTGSYPDRNSISDYIPEVNATSIERKTRKARDETRDIDDEIPF